MLATVLLLGLVSVAAVTDLAWHKIYNWTTYTGILLALALSAGGLLVFPDVSRGTETRISFAESLLGLVACGFAVLVCFVLFRIGGGDVKLIAMMGAFLGPQLGITAMLWTFVLGACVGLIALIWRVGPVKMTTLILRRTASLFGWQWGVLPPLTEAQRAELQPPLFLAPSALAATIIARFSLVDWLM